MPSHHLARTNRLSEASHDTANNSLTAVLNIACEHRKFGGMLGSEAFGAGQAMSVQLRMQFFTRIPSSHLFSFQLSSLHFLIAYSSTVDFLTHTP